MHIYICTYIYLDTCVCMYTYIHTCIHVHTHIHTYTHTYIHTYIHTCMIRKFQVITRMSTFELYGKVIIISHLRTIIRGLRKSITYYLCYHCSVSSMYFNRALSHFRRYISIVKTYRASCIIRNRINCNVLEAFMII